MSQSAAPNFGNDLIRIHRVITRGLQTAIQHTQDLIKDNAAADSGFLDYLAALISVLDSHHMVEDEIAFPYLQQKRLPGPYQVLVAEHKTMAHTLEKIQEWLPDLSGEAPKAQSLVEVNQALKSILGLWMGHIGREEESFSPKIAAALMGEEEHINLGRAMSQHAQQHSGPDYLVIPFILYNLNPKDRAVMMAAMPPVITQELLPGPWKEKWAAMQPYLLE